MKKTNQNQIIGFLFVFLGVILAFLVDNSIIKTSAGIITAIGIALMFKILPIKTIKM